MKEVSRTNTSGSRKQWAYALNMNIEEDETAKPMARIKALNS